MGMIIKNGKIYSSNAERRYREVTLWLGPATPDTSGLDITLSDAITNYDEIVFDLISENGRKYQDSFLVSSLTIGSTYLEALYAAESQGIFWTYTNETSINIKRITTGSETAITYNKIVGVKYGDVVKKEEHHKYSTNEHVVGEWIDGKTLYERTWSFTSASSTSYTRVDLGLTNIDTCFLNTTGTFIRKDTNIATIGSYNSSITAEEFLGFVNIYNDSLSFDYRVGASYQRGNMYVTVRYTKTS